MCWARRYLRKFLLFRNCNPVWDIGQNLKRISSVQFNHSVMSDSLQPHESQHTRPPCTLPTPGVYSNSCPSNRWCHAAISSSVIPFSSRLQSLLAAGSFPMSQLFTWGGQSIGVSASASLLLMNTQDWSPSGWTGWMSLQSKGLSRVFSNTIAQKHQFFQCSAFFTVQLSHPYMTTGKTITLTRRTFVGKVITLLKRISGLKCESETFWESIIKELILEETMMFVLLCVYVWVIFDSLWRHGL